MSIDMMVNPQDRPSDEYRIQLNAWHSSFGTTQLTHALAERDTLISVLKECVCALASCRWSADVKDFSKANDALTHAKSTLSKYER